MELKFFINGVELQIIAANRYLTLGSSNCDVAFQKT